MIMTDAEGEAHDHDHAEGATHEGGGVHGEPHDLVPDPHIWHSASNNAAMVEVIATNLAQVNPDQADFYQDNAAQLSAQFSELDGWIQTQVDTIPVNNRPIGHHPRCLPLLCQCLRL